MTEPRVVPAPGERVVRAGAARAAATRRSRYLARSLVVLLCGPQLCWASSPGEPTATYRAEVRALFGLIRTSFDGTIELDVGEPDGKYRLRAQARGAGVTQTLESVGHVLDGRFVPTRTMSTFRLGRRSTETDLQYDYGDALVRYHHVGHTRVLARRWTAQGTIPLVPDQPVNDMVTTLLNHVADRLERAESGSSRVVIVARRPNTEPFQLGLVPVSFAVVREDQSDSHVGLLDLTPLSSWARTNKPARITFGPDRMPTSIEAVLKFGTRIQVSLAWRAPLRAVSP